MFSQCLILVGSLCIGHHAQSKVEVPSAWSIPTSMADGLAAPMLSSLPAGVVQDLCGDFGQVSGEKDICAASHKSELSSQLPRVVRPYPHVRLKCTVLHSDESELQIVREGGLIPILEGATSSSVDLQSQCARAMRNLSVNREYPFVLMSAHGTVSVEGMLDHWRHAPYIPVMMVSGNLTAISRTPRNYARGF